MQKYFIFVSLLVLGTGCGFTAKDLTPTEKRIDVEWIFGVFERNYAPAQMKAQKHGITLEQAKQNCLQWVESVNGDQFYATLQKCTAQFKDAHTRMMAVAQVLPEFTFVHYLGFTTDLVKLKIPQGGKEPSASEILIRVSSLLPSVDPNGFPIQKNDLIVEINGQSARDYLMTELSDQVNLGHEPATLVAAAQQFPLRVGYTLDAPTGSDLTMTVYRAGVKSQVVLPWIKKDLVAFTKEQDDARKAKEKPKAVVTDEKANTPEPWNRHDFGYWVGGEFIEQIQQIMDTYRKSPGTRANILLNTSFKVFAQNDAIALVNSFTKADAAEAKLSDPTPFDATAKLLKMAVVDMSQAPFVARLVVREDNKKIGYVSLPTFNIDDAKTETFRKIIAKFNSLKVDQVIVDMLNNGGGSITHGMKIVNMLAEKKIQYPSVQFALNDNWINAFKGDYYAGSNDSARELAGRVYRAMKEDLTMGKKLSRNFSLAELDVFPLTADKNECVSREACLSAKIKLVVLINEMCASTCDLVASAVKDNQLGVLMGSQSMGAGGNVVPHMMTPISRMIMTQTESLAVDLKGNYLENNGVLPDVSVDTIEDIMLNYQNTYKQSLTTALQ
jgi:C-terminal processing protease CtpA/Prc